MSVETFLFHHVHLRQTLRFRFFLLQLAEELLKRETLNYEDIVKLIGPPPFPNKQKIDIIDWDDTGESGVSYDIR